MIREQFQKIYEEGGASAVCDHASKNRPELDWEYCAGCDALMPVEKHECLCCGQDTK